MAMSSPPALIRIRTTRRSWRGSAGTTQDLRIGAEIASVTDGEATLQIVLEESDDLTSWSHRETVDLVVPLQAGETTKFFPLCDEGCLAVGGSQ